MPDTLPKTLVSVFDVMGAYNKNMDKEFNNSQYQNYYGLSKEERRRIAIEVAEMRQQMFRDILEHNRRVLKHNEHVLEAISDCEQEDDMLFFFNSAHPLVSLFATWFANRQGLLC